MSYTYKQLTWWAIGWVFIRPIRWFFRRMVCNSYLHGFRFVDEWDDKKNRPVNRLRWPNLHWWLLDQTVFRFFKWVHYDAWRPFCTWDRFLVHKPWYAEVIHWIGRQTAGYSISGGRCFHCGNEAGDPHSLANAEEEDDEYFTLTETGTSATMDGTEYWFRGITTCPCCGFKQEYSDGS